MWLVGDLPDKAGELAGDSDRNGGAALAALVVEVAPAAVQSQLGSPGRLDRGWWLALLTLAQRHGDARGAPVCQAASMSNRRAWLEPALVIAPWRRLVPEDCSPGTRPR